jgi:hypothetical protein
MKCKLCGKEVKEQWVYDNFCGMHVKCENESNDCMMRTEND